MHPLLELAGAPASRRPALLLFLSIRSRSDEAPSGVFSSRGPISVDNHRRNTSTAGL